VEYVVNWSSPVRSGSKPTLLSSRTLSVNAQPVPPIDPHLEPMKTPKQLNHRSSASSSLLAALLLLPFAQAEVRLPNVFTSHMVLQCDRPIPVWGWAQPDEAVSVQLGSEIRQTRANPKGEWRVDLPAHKPGGPHVLTVTGSNTIRLDDVLVGEVWLCSGQSNMEMGIAACRDAQQEIAAASYPRIRLLLVPNRWTPMPQDDTEAAWKTCTPAAIAEGGWGGFSAAAYYFGRELHQRLDGVPVGLIDATWGGTRIESWTPPEGFAGVPALRRDFERVQLGDPRSTLHKERLEQTLKATEQWLGAARKSLADQTLVPAMPAYPEELHPPRDVQHATALYNGMIHPLRPLALRGAIWYQGESNSSEGRLYTERMKALIDGWRRVFDNPDLAFYFVQIAPFNYGGNPEVIAEFWEAQTEAQQIPHTGMVVINDIGDLKDIHPTNKQDVGRRLAGWALAQTYKQTGVVWSGPTFKSLALEGGTLRVTFDHADGGLASRDGKPLSWFEIIDADEGGFVPAQARIDGASVVLSAPEVKRPVAMRFAWSMLAEPNLMNGAGLPAGAFRAGTAPARDLLSLKVPEAREYELVYDLDLSTLGPTITYTANRSAQITRPFDRVAYFIELQTKDGNTQYAFVSMEAFVDSAPKLALPTASTGLRFQQTVSNLTIYSNVKGVATGKNLPAGNIEFWPHNYGTANSAGVPNASASVYDFGDQPGDPVDGYGCLQVHNFNARQTVFAVNHWREGKGADLGIGNQPTGNPDWTFAGNADSYSAKRLRIFVRCKP